MSRTITRLFAGLALVAATATTADAQLTCTRIAGVNGGGCPIAINANLLIPNISFLSVASGTLTLDVISNWDAFFTAAVVDSTYTALPLTIRSNVGNVALSVTASALTGTATAVAGNTRTFADYGFKLEAAGSCTADGYTVLTNTPQAISGIPTGPLNAPTLSLCVASVFNPADLTKLRAGTYTLPLALTITAP
jgi:hypothetical protein